MTSSLNIFKTYLKKSLTLTSWCSALETLLKIDKAQGVTVDHFIVVKNGFLSFKERLPA